MKQYAIERRFRCRNELRFLLPWLLSTILSAGCDLPGRPANADPADAVGKAASFDALYAAHCAGCHGAKGRLGPAPPLNDPLFLAIVPDDVLHEVVQQGRRGTLMPAFAKQHGGRLTEEQVQVLVRGIKSRWRSKQPTPGDVPRYLLPSSADGTNEGNGTHADDRSAGERGAEVFARACAGCHGLHGKGADAGPIRSPDLLELLSDQVLRRYMITGRPDLGMPDYAQTSGRAADFKPLTDQEINDVVALLAEWRAGRSSSGAPETNETPTPSSAETQ